MSGGPGSLPPEIVAAIREQARIDVAKAPPLKEWQLQVICPMWAASQQRTSTTARRRAA